MKERIKLIPIEYDESFIKKEYLPKLKILTDCRGTVNITICSM